MEGKIKKKLYFAKLNRLFYKYLKEGKITKFDDEIYEKMSNTIIAGLPVSLSIKYSNHLFGKGTCYDRSLYMFLALDDALLVRGNNKDLEYNFGEGHEGHGWIEIDNYVYDPSLMWKFEKDIYYKLYKCSNVIKIDKKTYLAKHKDFVEDNVSYDLNEFRPNGKRRLELWFKVSMVRFLSKKIDDEQFTKDLNKYLSLIEYDEERICNEREKEFQKTLMNNNYKYFINND